MLQNTFVAFHRAGNVYTINVYDLNESNKDKYVVKRFSYESEVEVVEGELVSIGDAVYIAPHNKVIYLYEGEWYLRDFVSTTPIVSTPEIAEVTDSDGDGDVEVEVEVGEAAVGFITLTEPKNVSRIYVGTTSINVDGTVVTASDPIERNFTQYGQSLVTALNEQLSDYTAVGFFESTDTATVYTITLTRRFLQQYTGPIEIIEVPDGLFDDDPTFPATTIKSVDISGGVTPDISQVSQNDTNTYITGRLLQNQTYAYTARYRYRDGHITQVCYPVFVDTSNNRRYVTLDIKLVFDIDGTFADVEIFRKQGSGEFELIERLRSPQPNLTARTLRYNDFGKLGTTTLNNRISVWTTRHETQAVVRDRYVRANVEYPDRRPQDDFFTLVKNQEIPIDREGLPTNSIVKPFTKVRYADGLESFFVADKNEFRPTQEGILASRTDISEGKELAYYATYDNLPDTETIRFRTTEIYNQNVPSFATETKELELQDRPASPHIFYGYRYISLRLVGSFYVPHIRRSDDLPINDRNVQLRPAFSLTTQLPITELPDRIFITLGATIPSYSTVDPSIGVSYVKKIVPPGNVKAEVLYELEHYSALIEAVSNGSVVVKSLENNDGSGINRSTGEPIILPVPNYSTEVPNSLFFNVDIPVIGLEDKSVDNSILADTGNNGRVFAPERSEVYLVLDPESIYSRFTFRTGTTTSWGFPFSLLNLQFASYSDNVPTNTVFYDRINGNGVVSCTEFNYDTGLRNLKNVNPDVPPIFIGKTLPGQEQTDLRTGYIKRRFRGYEYYELAEYNIYETLVTEADFGGFVSKFVNQLTWSDEFVTGTNLSGVRNFRPESFMNISSEHGPIVKIDYVANNLLVFCVNGVAIVSVGEVLTQGTEAQILVDTSRFLNSEMWLLTGMNNIDKRSIKRYENMIFFADDNDVWMYSGQMQNISAGAIPVSGGRGMIDPINKEYQLTVNGETWAYNLEANEWSGPYTYSNTNNTFADNRVISVIDGRIVDHNITNEFDGLPFETVVESVSEDLGDPSTDKLYRKFYVQTAGDALFEYTKDTDLRGRNLSEYRKTGDTYQIGIAQIGAAKRLYWKVTTTVKDFVLKLVAFEYTPRNRR
jgi:hypothetical protein